MKKKPQTEGSINGVSQEEIISSLGSLQASALYLTQSVRRYNTDKWPNNQMSFVEFHMSYLKAHPLLDPRQYVSNLKLILKKSPR